MPKSLASLTETANLITLPEVYIRLKSILDEADYAMAEVAVLISHDPAITARLLRLVNSSLFGLRRKIETVSHAIAMLGVQQIHDIVLATAVTTAFDGISPAIMDMSLFWQRSVRCAVTARRLAASGDCDRERLFVCGLLHDIGHRVLYQAMPGQAEQALIEARERRQPLYQVERQLIGFDYATVGGTLIDQWGLSDQLRETTTWHVEPDRATSFPAETALIHLAALLAESSSGQGTFNEGPLAVSPCALENNALSVEQCLAIAAECEEETQEVMALFFP